MISFAVDLSEVSIMVTVGGEGVVGSIVLDSVSGISETLVVVLVG